MAYRFTMPPQDVSSLPAYLAREFSAVAGGFNDAADGVQLNPLSAAPKKPRMGLMVCADGVNWKPDGVSGGFFGFFGGVWVKLG